MRRDDLKELHYITSIANVVSILKVGILSHRYARLFTHRSVAWHTIQDRRRTVRVPNGLMLHEYVNLYVCARNPMMAARSIDHENLCVLRVSTKVLDLPKVMIADRNAASDYVRFGPAPLALGLIDRTLVFADDWAHPGDQADEWHRKSAKCAEVLVPNRVSPRQLLGAYASCVVSQEILGNIAPQLDVILNPRLFFH